jgi:hypothetical protein
MEDHQEHQIKIDGELVAELLDQDEYPSNVGEVAAISDRQICVLRRDWDELTHFRQEYLDVDDCRAIEYEKERSWYRTVGGAAFLIAAAVVALILLIGLDDFAAEGAPLIIGMIMLVTMGLRLIMSTHRHVIRFEMPDETLVWRAPPIDFKSKAGAAHAVREYARKRGILRVPEIREKNL